MNVLLISFSFPPAGGVGVLRALSLAKYLPEYGIRVDVLAARNAPSVGKDLSLLQQVPPDVTVHRCWTLDLPFFLRKRIKGLVSGKRAPQSAQLSPGPAQHAKRRPAALLKNALGNLLLPDPQVGWLPFAFPAAKRIIRARGIDAVLITVPPFSSVRLATKLRAAFPELPILVDFRDEWLTTTLDLVSFNKNDRARLVARKTESDAVRDATAVVLVTEAARRELMGRYPSEDAGKFHCVPNGFDTRTASSGTVAATRSSEVVVLTYIGSVYGSTDPTSFVEAVLDLSPELRRRLRVRFIGHIETETYRSTLERLGETVELQGFLPQAEALKAMEDTDHLLLITHDRINVSAKFYDYISGTKPIVAAIQPEGDVRLLLEKTQTGVWADVKDPASIRAMLTKVLSHGDVPFQPAQNEIAKYHRRALAGEYASLIQSL